MNNSIHVFRFKDKWIVKETLSKKKVDNASFKKRKDAVKFALSYKKGEKLTVFVHNIYNGTIELIAKTL